MNPTWIAIGISLIGAIAAISGAWAVTRYEVKQMKEQKKTNDEAHVSFMAAIKAMEIAESKRSARQEVNLSNLMNDLRETIRLEFTAAINRINSLVFEDGGTSRYVPRNECEKCKVRCREEVNRRLDKIEEIVHTRRDTD